MAKFIDEDLGPYWLRDYNSIQANLSCVRDFADCLHAELEINYLPHRERVSADMTTPVASPASEFGELCGFLDTHWQSQVLTNALLAEYANATNALALAATAISDAYRDADGQAMARSKDVAALLGAEPAVRAVPDGGTGGSAANGGAAGSAALDGGTGGSAANGGAAGSAALDGGTGGSAAPNGGAAGSAA